eukprot:3232368-Alexandrium_andersonii.AAC.1
MVPMHLGPLASMGTRSRELSDSCALAQRHTAGGASWLMCCAGADVCSGASSTPSSDAVLDLDR